MIQDAPINAAQEEVVFSAKYSFKKASVFLVIYCLVMWSWLGFTHTIAHDIYEGIVLGEGPLHFLLLGSILLLLLAPILLVGFNPLFFKEIIFYSNRLKIVRRILGCKTVSYSNAQVERGTLTAGYLIEKAREKGKAQRTRFFYDIEASFFSSETREAIETILNYLTEDTSKKNPRFFKRPMLPRDLLLKGAVQRRAQRTTI